MATLIFAFVGMLFLVGIMAVGVIFGRRPIAGSCGGIAQLGLDAECEICGGKPQDCPSSDDSRLSYNAEQ